MKRILNFGSLNLDTFYFLDHIVRPGETISATRMEQHLGGKGMNQSVALARAGASVWHAGKIGADGLELQKTLEENHVNCTYLSTEGSSTGRALIQKEDSGQNCIIVSGGANREITEQEIDRILANFGPGDILVSQNEISCVPYLLDRAAGRGMELALNPSPMDDTLKEYPLEKLTWLVVNEIEAGQLAGTSSVSEIQNFFQRGYPRLNILLTLGGEGAVYLGPQGMVSHPAYSVPVMDTTAAGDTFLGFFLASAVSGQPAAKALEQASAAAALAVTKPGAIPSIPTQEDVSHFLQGGTER